ncbi:HupE/UreJ family protein [Cohnella abietis]|uniref:Uncharacterized protein n=1 Tax=Cohnella abietis TaxID=2507935 RepID=A0A3T1DCD1_9BACL|nr:HupE/UreJ family protein [Cohnella abietis]BBI35595.1 hypothetical protein KCTCHS21_49940 [Cohnella abietis]
MFKRWSATVAIFLASVSFMFVSWAPTSFAHGDSVAFLDLSLKKGVISSVIQIDLNDLRMDAIPPDEDPFLKTPEHIDKFLKKYQKEVGSYLLSNMTLYSDYLPLKGKMTQLKYIEKEGEPQPFAEAILEYPVRDAPKIVELSYNLVLDRDPWHVAYVNLEIGELKKTEVFVEQIRKLQIGQMSVQDAFQRYFMLGLMHMLTDFMVILFLVGFLISCRYIKKTIAAISIFIGVSSITLILASMQILTIPSNVIESVTVLSIIIVALYALFSKNKKYILWAAGGFGLVYGFGFSTGLAGIRAEEEHLVPSVVAFNVGIEVALILIALILYFAIRYLFRIKKLDS